MWGAILSAVGITTILGLIYLFTRFRRFGFVRRIAGDRKWVSRLLGLIPIFIFVIFSLFNMYNAIIVMLHLIVFWALAEFVTRIVRKLRGKSDAAKGKDNSEKLEESGASEEDGKPAGKIRPYWLGIGVILFTAVYLCIGYYLANHIWVTTYDLTTDKDLGQKTVKAVLFADSHIGTLFDGEGFAKEMEKIQAENPDIVLIAGDYVDDSTSKEDMIRSCQALGELKTTYGIYYVSGNHDRGYFNRRAFSYEDMVAEFEKNGVTVLQDDVTLVNDSFYIIGRKDKSTKGGRLSMEELVAPLDREKYMIVLDHQPSDYDAQAAAGVDLVLSGHTHGGQLIPINHVGEWIGANDRTYGLETRGSTNFVVTSGIADWAIWFKTGTKSEYVVLNITGK